MTVTVSEHKTDVGPTGEQDPASASWRPAWLRLFLGFLLVASAATAWERVFPPGPLLRTAAIAIGTSTALVAARHWYQMRRLRPVSLWLVLSVATGVWLALVPAALPAGASANPLWALHALRTCWYDLLTTAPPAPADPALMIGVYALLWCAAWGTGEVLVRGRKVLPALAFGFLALVAGVVVGTGDRRAGMLAAGLFSGVALLLLIEHASWRRTFVLAVPTVVAIATSAVVLAPNMVAGQPPYDPRQLVHPQAQPDDVTDPLDQLPGWLAHPATPLFHVTASAAQNWRLAALDRFDGRTWSTSGAFWPVTTHLPTAGAAAAASADGSASDAVSADAVSPAAATSRTPPTQPFPQRITVDSLSGPWLPAAPTPTHLAAPGLSGVLADPVAENLMTRDGLQPGRAYDVVSRLPDLTAARLSAAVPDPAGRADTVLPPGLPQVVSDTAEQAVAGATSPFQQASRLEHYLRGAERNDPAAPPGHTYGHLAYFLGVSHRGTSEQFATAFAVMARSVGLPSRVVVGFRPGTETTPGEWQVSGADAFAWPEVDFAGLGWVPFFPTPGAAPSTPDTAALAEGQAPERARLDEALDDARQPQGGPEAAPPEPPNQPTAKPVRPTNGGDTWLLWAGCGAAIPVGYLAVVLTVPWLRRRRSRRLAGTAHRVDAAWRATLGRLRWIGMTEIAALTNSEIADVAARRLGAAADSHLAPLAELADAAAYANLAGVPDFSGFADDAEISAPGDRRLVTEPEPEPIPAPDPGASAWTHHDHLAALIRRRAGARAALWHTVRPRALRD